MRIIPILLVTSLLLPLCLLPVARGDLDVNTVVGRVTLDGEPAPEGTIVTVHDITTGHRQTTPVDGPMIPFFLNGEGRYDTGDVPAFNTEDEVVVTMAGAQGSSRAYLRPGTTTVDLVAISTSPPSISAIPEQRGLEDVPWTLDLAPYVRDQDTPPNRLALSSDGLYTKVDGLSLTFLYPEGVTVDVVKIRISDGFESDATIIRVRVTPVNDPPRLSTLPDILLEQGGNASIDLTPHLSDPDHGPGEMEWRLDGADPVSGSFRNSTLSLWSPLDWTGSREAKVIATDPGGLSANASLRIIVEPNYALLFEELTQKVETLEGLLESSRRERDEALLSETRLMLLVGNLTDRTADLESTLASTRQEAAELRSRMEEELGEAAELEESLRGKLANLTTQMNLREMAVAEMNERISDLLIEHGLVVEMAREREERLNATILSLKAIAREREDLLAREKENNTDLAGQIALLLGREVDLLEDLEDLEEERTSLSRKLANITEALELLESEEAAQEAMIAGLRDELGRLRGARVELEKELEEKSDEVVSVSRSAKAREDTIEAMHRKSVRDMEIALGVLVTVAIPATWVAFRLGKRRRTAAPAESRLPRYGGRWRPGLGLRERIGSMTSKSVRFKIGLRPHLRLGGRGWMRMLARQVRAPFGLLTRAWKCRARARRRALAKLRARSWRREKSRLRARERNGTVPGRAASPRQGSPSRRKARWRYALRPRKIAGMSVRQGPILRSSVPRSQRTGSRSRWGPWQHRFPDAMLLRSSRRRG